MTEKKRVPCEVYSRVVGYYRPVQQWNAGARQMHKDRRPYIIAKDAMLDGDGDTSAGTGGG